MPGLADPIVLSIVIPVLDDAGCLQQLLDQLVDQLVEKKGEVIVVDGGSRDNSAAIAKASGAKVVMCEPGRAKQMNEGASHAQGKILLFLHADSIPPAAFPDLILDAMIRSKRVWGRFDVRLSGDAWMLRVVEFMMNVRSAYTGICTGDQGIFVKAEIFEQVGGFPDIALMEDVAFSKRLPRPCRVREPLVTSSRRWEQKGIWKTIGLMWLLRLRFFLGADPNDLAQVYRHAR